MMGGKPMKMLILAAGALALSTAARADETVTTKEYGNYSAPVAGATPQARENPAPGTTVLRERQSTTVETIVVEPQTTTTVVRPSTATVIERRE
jgi:hypothetical protein